MKARALIQELARLDGAGVWLFSVATLRTLFPEKASTFYRALDRHCRAGIIRKLAAGHYDNPAATARPKDLLASLVPVLRPWDFNYLSLESRLSECGRISQMPGRLTVMTTGRAQVTKPHPPAHHRQPNCALTP